MSHSSSELPSGPTLYDPPRGRAEDVPDRDDAVELEIDLPEALATQLSDVARHLGLAPSILAARAVELVCDEVGLVQNDELSSATLIQRYQTRIDLLHRLDDALEGSGAADESADGDAYDWNDVDSIIGRVVDPSE